MSKSRITCASRMVFNRFLFASIVYVPLTILSCAENRRESNGQDEHKSQVMYSIVIFVNKDSTFGYDILKKSNVFIHQPMIPGMQGALGFPSKSKANGTAQLVVRKLEMGENPPTVSQDEINNIFIYY